MRRKLSKRETRHTWRVIWKVLKCLVRGHDWDISRYDPRFGVDFNHKPAKITGGTTWHTTCKRCGMGIRHC